MLKLTGIKKDYITASETVHALKGVDLCFRKNEFVSVLGPSGCGKTTLLNIIGGLDHYTDGDLVINGRSTRFYRDRDWDVYRNHRIGFIFQSYNLIPHQTILGNVELALTIAGIGKEERIARAKEALDKVGLKGQYYKRPNQLSGGQCQRVAIARALVNNPEILLADEPTGALDTVTSTQIMELVKEISKERLVIMVTHNPELAEEYSSRIIRLLDGKVIEDSNPFSPEDEATEVAELAALAATEEEAKEPETPVKTKTKNKKKKSEKAKMSFFTAFKLSARNLISKKGRTTMVGIAGSIGIIGIACVLAFSAGIKGYIASMQDDMLSGNPISITEVTYDLSVLTGMMGEMMEDTVGEKVANSVYVSSLIEYIAKMDSTASNSAIENDITREYIEYLKAMPKTYYNDMIFDYGYDINYGLYTDFFEKSGSEAKKMSVSAITAMYTSILKETEFKDYAEYVGMLAPSFEQLPTNYEHMMTQYDLVGEGSRYATEANEIMLVLNSDDELSDLLLARFGFFNQDQFLEIVNKATGEDGAYDESLYKKYFTYEELLGKTLTWYSNDDVFLKTEIPNPMTGEIITNYSYAAYADKIESEGMELKVVGILTPKDNISFGTVQSGIFYTEEFANHVLEENRDSQIFEHIMNIDETDTTTAAMMKYYIVYNYTYSYGDIVDKQTFGYIGPSTSMQDIMMGMTGGASQGVDHAEMKADFIRSLGGNDLANSVKIYPISFDDKYLVTEYLDEWNDNEENEITYTDTLELVISMINTMIDVVSYALIAFTSISLVVSTVMIGIITYVSVVERIKEIGVIRSLGGRKRDVSALFNAETFIIGLLAGLIGVIATYGISLVVNMVLGPIINYSNIAALPIDNAVVLVVLSVLLTSVSGLLPARSAARKDPVVALRTE